MAKATLASIRTLSDKLHNRWTREFAGKPRHTRDLAELEKILEKAAVLAKKAKGIPGEKGDALEKVVVERLQLYRAERDAIAEAQFDRPEIAEIHALGLAVDRALSIWRRHYAGRDRRTRDLWRLDAIIGTLAQALPRLEALAEHPEVKKDSLDSLRGQLELLKDERGEIDKLRRTAEPAVKVNALLAEAQSALDQYRVHFAGQPRPTCAPARLRRIIAMLEAITAELATLTPDDDKNLPVLLKSLELWRAEVPELDKAIANVAPRDVSNQLGLVANQLFQVYQREYAGQARVTRNLQRLSEVCDRLAEIAELMARHDAAHAEPVNRRNMPVVDERLRRYEAEWTEIAKAKAQAQAQAPQGAGTPGPAAALPGISIAKKEP